MLQFYYHLYGILDIIYLILWFLDTFMFLHILAFCPGEANEILENIFDIFRFGF